MDIIVFIAGFSSCMKLTVKRGEIKACLFLYKMHLEREKWVYSLLYQQHIKNKHIKKISMFGDFVSDAKMQEFKNIQ